MLNSNNGIRDDVTLKTYKTGCICKHDHKDTEDNTKIYTQVEHTNNLEEKRQRTHDILDRDNIDDHRPSNNERTTHQLYIIQQK